MKKRLRCGKAILLIALKKGSSARDFEELFHSEACSTSGSAMTEAWLLPIGEEEIPRVAHQALMESSPPPFNAVVQLSSSDTAALSDRLAVIVDRLNAWIDRSRSALLIGNEIKITTGNGAVLVVMPLRRQSGLTHDEFMTHWFERHACLGEAVEGVRYRQNHVDYAATDALAKRLSFTFEPIDGLAESYFSTTNEAFELMSRKEIAVDAIVDEKRFIDHNRSHFGFYRILDNELRT